MQLFPITPLYMTASPVTVVKLSMLRSKRCNQLAPRRRQPNHPSQGTKQLNEPPGHFCGLVLGQKHLDRLPGARVPFALR